MKPRCRLSFNKILEEVENGTLDCFLTVNINTTDHLKEKFKDIHISLKNALISKSDIWDYSRFRLIGPPVNRVSRLIGPNCLEQNPIKDNALR